MNFGDLFDLRLFDRMMDEGMIRVQKHPTGELLIYNYSAQCQYAREWNDATEQCRGLIIRPGGEIVARPFRKFFNYGELEAGVSEFESKLRPGHDLDLDAPVVVTDKMDGSLGILYPVPGTEAWDGEQVYTEYAIATRGSFTSDQAVWATSWLQNHYHLFSDYPQWWKYTYLFEIIYPANRIVVDYGSTEALFLLGAVELDTGRVLAPRDILEWEGPKAHTTEYTSLRTALEAPMRENAEGLVVRYVDNDHMLKIKQEDYVTLHRIMTGMSARNIWEIVAVQACKDLITKPTHWASYVGIDPARATEILGMEDDWLESVPDEYYEWVRSIQYNLRQQFEELWDETLALSVTAEPMKHDKRMRFEFLNAKGPFAQQIIRLLDKGDDSMLRLRIWRELEPTQATRPFAVNEDTA